MSSTSIQAIDVHAHYGTYDRGTQCMDNEFMTGDAELVVRRARQANTRITIVSPLEALLPRFGGDPVAGNKNAARIVAQTDGLRQWVVIDPTKPETYQQAEEMLKLPRCVGIKIHPEEHGYPIAQHGRPIFAFAARHKAVVLSHSSERNSLAADLVVFANEFPEMKLILAHIGCGWDGDPTHQVRGVQHSKHGNVFADTSSARSITPGLIEWAVREVGAERVLYGTDTPLYFAPMQRARIDHADLSDEVKRLILCDNAMRLLNLPAGGQLTIVNSSQDEPMRMNQATDPLAFSPAEYQSRVQRVQAEMTKRGLDVLLVRNRADVCYLTGMQTCYMVAYHAVLVPASGDAVLLTSDFEMLNALLGVWCSRRTTFPVGADPLQATCLSLRELGFAGSRIGIEKGIVSANHLQSLREGLPEARFEEAGDILPRLKVIKSPAEIAHLREAGRMTTLGMEAAFDQAVPGKTENDLAAAAASAMIGAGSEFMCIDPIVTAGARSGVPHSTYRRNVLRPGDPILIELGACKCRYSAPSMRTVALTPVPDPVRRAADACRACLDVLIDHLRPGMLARDVAAKAKAAWMPLCQQLIWHGTYAYSVGIGFPPDWNDAPVCVTLDSDVVLRPGMCFHATTSLRRAGEYGTALSETVLITEAGNEILTGTERALRVV